MKNDIRKQAVRSALIKDNSTDWRNIANKEIEENKKLKEKIDSLEFEIVQKGNSTIIEVNPEECRNWKYADRNSFELGDIEELTGDIKQNGQLQPAIIRKIDSLDYKYEVIAGERRWRACKLAGIKLQAIITNEDDAGCLIIQTSENKKKSLSSYSLAIVYEKLMNDLNISQNELSRRLNIPKSSFSELMSFNKVPKELWDAVEDMSKVTSKTAAFLASICNKGDEDKNIIFKLSDKIREGYGSETLSKLIDKYRSNIKANRSFTKVYENSKGEVLFRITSEGRISLSKTSISRVDLIKLADHLTQYLETFS